MTRTEKNSQTDATQAGVQEVKYPRPGPSYNGTGVIERKRKSPCRGELGWGGGGGEKKGRGRERVKIRGGGGSVSKRDRTSFGRSKSRRLEKRDEEGYDLSGNRGLGTSPMASYPLLKKKEGVSGEGQSAFERALVKTSRRP